jgi:hypothetical protein
MTKILTLIIVLWCSTVWAVEPINLARMNAYVAGAGGAAAANTDACTSGLLFSWHMENTDVTTGGVAGGVNNGCSAGDSTATANGAGVTLDTSVFQDGAKSIKSVTGAGANRYEFDWASGDILATGQGTIDFWMYYTGTLAGHHPFYLIVNTDNRIYCFVDGANYLGCIWTYGAAAVNARTNANASIFPASTWIHCKVRWHKGTAHSGLYQKVTCDGTTGESNSNDNGTNDLGTWAGTAATFAIGDTGNGTGLTLYIDNLKIYDTWQ